jgi:DNA-binding response OmpR family regulator
MVKILVVEDEAGIAFGLKIDLQTEGYEVAVVSDGLEAVEHARTGEFDLILLDIMLPSRDGLEVCRELRRSGLKTPIILLTAKTHEAEKIVGLDVGADDYVTKPFSPRELRARIRALLRRANEDGQPDCGGSIYRFGPFELDLLRFELRRDGSPLDTTTTELKLLCALARNRGRVLTRDRLLDEVWGKAISVTDRVIDNHVVALRKKIEDEPATPRYLISVRGVGYRFDG